MKKSLRITNWIGIAAAALMVAVVVMHFIPFWRYQGESASIAAYIWRPYKNTAFTELFRSYFGKGFKMTLLLGLPMALSLVGNAAGAVACAVKSSRAAVYMIPVVGGLSGLLGLLVSPVFKLSGLWLPLLVLHGLVLAVGILGSVLAAISKKKG